MKDEGWKSRKGEKGEPGRPGESRSGRSLPGAATARPAPSTIPYPPLTTPWPLTTSQWHQVSCFTSQVSLAQAFTPGTRETPFVFGLRPSRGVVMPPRPLKGPKGIGGASGPQA